jgi:opacity protein-like surface antigen
MRDALAVRRLGVHLIIALLVLASSARQAHAQGFVSPFIGYNFSGDSGCPQITNCEDKHVNWGVGFGALGSIVGFEAEYARTSDFFGDTPNQSTEVVTFMGNFMLAPKIGPVQPYGLAGVGLIRTAAESGSSDNDENQFGWDAGGGLMAFFSAHVGIRGDIRYFHSFQLLDLSKLPNLPIGETKLDYGRFSGAVVFKF